MTERSTDYLHQHSYTAPAGFASPQLPLYKASTVYFESVAAMRAHEWRAKTGYSYGLHGTPASFALEDAIAKLEGADYCTLYPSGLAAIANVNFALLQSGDEVLIPDNAYGPNLHFAQTELTKFGISYAVYDAMSASDLAARINAKTRLVWLEAAGSVSMEFPPLAELVSVCKAKQVVTVLDNTWGAGLAFAPFALAKGLGVDVSVHALTKYPSGGADLLMGSVSTRGQALHLKIKNTRMHLGWGCAASDVHDVLKGLATIELRYRAQDASARQLASFLQSRDEISEVLHPALSGAKTDSAKTGSSHANWLACCGEQGLAASVFSVVFDAKYSREQVDRFCENLQCFKLGYSWAGPVSLVVPYDMPAMRTLSQASWQGRGILVRFAIGLENSLDLQQDLTQALASL